MKHILKAGDSVVMHTCLESTEHEGRVWVCQTDEQKLHPSHNYTVVWLEGYSGCFSTDYLQLVNVEDRYSPLYSRRKLVAEKEELRETLNRIQEEWRHGSGDSLDELLLEIFNLEKSK